MKITPVLYLFLVLLIFPIQYFGQIIDSQFLSWNTKTAKSVGESWREKGRVGGFFDTRIFNTNSSYNYKLRATLMSPEAIRAAAKMEQINNRLTDNETIELVKEAEKENLIIIIEIDPREGSGIIPNSWRAFIGAKNAQNEDLIRGEVNNDLRNIKALNSVSKRDYDYDIFWVSFPLTDSNGSPIWQSIPDELELVVGIKEKEGRVTWKVSNELRSRIEFLQKLKSENTK